MFIFEEIQHFLLIVEHGTFTEAARHAHLSQPALTASVRRLEQSFGARLLHRGRAGASPTAAGQALLPRARAALAAVDDGRRAVREVLGLERGEVRIGAGATACTYLLPPILAEFRRDHPGVRFLLRESTTAQALDSLHSGELDLVVVSAVQGEHWRDDEFIVIASPKLETRGAPFVTFLPGATTRMFLDRYFPGVEIAMELGSIAAVKGHVRAGVGVALISRTAVAEDLRRGHLVEVQDSRTPIARTLVLQHRGEDRLPPATAALRERLLASASSAPN